MSLPWIPLATPPDRDCEVALCGWVGGMPWYSLGAAGADGLLVDLESGTVPPGVTHYLVLSAPESVTA